MTPGTWRTPLVVLAGGTAILLLSFGLRQNLGLYMAPLSAGLGWDREIFASAPVAAIRQPPGGSPHPCASNDMA